MLDEAGLVRTEKNRGVFVRDLPVEEAIEIFDLRAAMDELVGRRLAGSIDAGRPEGGARPRRADGAGGQGQGRAPLPPAQPALPRPPGRARRQRQADRDLSQADQGAEPVPPPQPGRRLADADLGGRAPADRQGDRLGRRRCRRPGDVRPRHGKQGANDQEPPRKPLAARRRDGAEKGARDDHRQRPPLRARPPAHRRRLRRRLRARLHRPGGRARPRAVAEGGARDRHDAGRRLRHPELHQPEQPVDRHRRAAVGARHLRQLPVRRRHGHRGDDERPEVAARADDPRRARQRRPVRRRDHRQGQAEEAPRPPHEGHLLLGREGRRGDRGRERHRRRRRAGRHAGAFGLQRRALGVRVRRRRRADVARTPPRRDVSLDHRLRAAQARPRHRRRRRVLSHDGRLPRQARCHGLHDRAHGRPRDEREDEDGLGSPTSSTCRTSSTTGSAPRSPASSCRSPTPTSSTTARSARSRPSTCPTAATSAP